MKVRSRSWVDQLLLILGNAAPPGDEERPLKRSLNRSPSIEPPTRPRIDARGLISIQPGNALRRRQQMTILGGGGFHAIPQPTRPDALAASRRITKQPKPLRAAAAPRADKHRPEAAVWERPYSDADPVFDAVVAEPDKRRHGIAPDETVCHQGGHANYRQIFNSGPHEVEAYRFSDQHSMLLCMMTRIRASFHPPCRRRAKTCLGPASRKASSAFRRPDAASPPTAALGCIVRPPDRTGQNPISLAGFDVERSYQTAALDALVGRNPDPTAIAREAQDSAPKRALIERQTSNGVGRRADLEPRWETSGLQRAWRSIGKIRGDEPS